MKGVKYVSLAETTGYGLSAVAYIGALLQAGVAVTWHPFVMTEAGYRPAVEAEQALRALSSMPVVNDLRAVFHAPVDYDTVIVHQTPEHWPTMIEAGKRMVGYTVWETDRLPLHWPALLQNYDLILTPSVFSRDVFAPHTGSPVVVIPHLPRDDWPAADRRSLAGFRRRFAIAADDFVFYTVNTWILRKAIWLTLHAYLWAFTESDPVVLFVKTNPDGESEGSVWCSSRRLFEGVLANYANPARIVFVSDELAHEDIGLLHLTGDAYVSLTRSEGFGLGAFDAATAGNPVVTTGWGGQLDFLPVQHACLVDYELRQVGRHLGNHAYQEQYWAHADLDHAVKKMRSLYRDPTDGAARGAALKTYVAEHFSAEATTRRLVQALDG